jgi:hypothetical protein
MSGLLTLLVAQRGYRHSSDPHLAARQFRSAGQRRISSEA